MDMCKNVMPISPETFTSAKSQIQTFMLDLTQVPKVMLIKSNLWAFQPSCLCDPVVDVNDDEFVVLGFNSILHEWVVTKYIDI
jgi:hypothetical protein